MRKVARGIIIDKKRILLIYRFKEERMYYVLPGGGIEDNETPYEAMIREAKEETNLDVNIDKLLFEFDDSMNYGYYFLCNAQGDLKLGGPEFYRQSKQNIYELVWIPLNQLEEMNLVPRGARDRIIELFRK